MITSIAGNFWPVNPSLIQVCFCYSGEAINVAAGFGFNGYDENGKAKWDLVDNVNVWVVEVSKDLSV